MKVTSTRVTPSSFKEKKLKKEARLKEAGVISNVYAYSVSYGLITNSERDNTDELKLDKLLSLVDTFVSYADGKYLNIYMFNVMGAMIELYSSK